MELMDQMFLDAQRQYVAGEITKLRAFKLWQALQSLETAGAGVASRSDRPRDPQLTVVASSTRMTAGA